MTPQQRAISAVQKATRAGALVSLRTAVVPCVDCGKRATEYDHRDYAQVLAVEPVCRACNGLRGRAKNFYDGSNVVELRVRIATDTFVALRQGAAAQLINVQEIVQRALNRDPAVRAYLPPEQKPETV